VFFREAARVLRLGGRVLMVEPAITWGSTSFYRLFHHEPVRTSADGPAAVRQRARAAQPRMYHHDMRHVADARDRCDVTNEIEAGLS
jgi:hypothetical protein